MMRRSLPLVALIAASALPGCGGGLKPGPSYPPSPDRLGSLDIQLTREGGAVTMTNTTARSLPPGRIWLNAWYSAPFDGLGIGETATFPITAFRDEHGEIVRGGGFFASEAPSPIWLAELQLDEGVHGLIVVRR